MLKFRTVTKRLLPILIGATLAIGTAWADKPEWAGKGKGHDKREQGERHGHSGEGEGEGEGEGKGKGKGKSQHFADQQRGHVRGYYEAEHHHGHCPPGLAKKHNGCMPPGQAKKWKVGKPLPRAVVYYDLPPALVVQIGVPPPNYRYVRVASDILLIAIGTGMVIDAIQDLGRL